MNDENEKKAILAFDLLCKVAKVQPKVDGRDVVGFVVAQAERSILEFFARLEADPRFRQEDRATQGVIVTLWSKSVARVVENAIKEKFKLASMPTAGNA